MTTKTHPRGDSRVSENVEFSKILKSHNFLKQLQIWGFGGAHGPGYMGLAATTWFPMGA